MTGKRPGDKKKEVVLVTGASGFIGRALVCWLAERYTVVALDRAGPPEPPPVAESVDMDLTSDASVHKALTHVRKAYGRRIASAIQLAAYFDLTGEPNPNYEKVTVRGTERLLKALHGFDVEQFAFVSTMLVHAPTQRGEPIDENSPLDPKLPYRESKIRAEQLLREQHADIPLVLVRPAGVYDDQCHAAFLAHQIARIFERKLNSRIYPGDLDTGQPFLHLDDLTEALARIVERRAKLPAELPLLLAESAAPGFGELQDVIGCAIHGEKWQTWQVPAKLARVGAVLEDKVFQVDPFIRPWMVDIAADHYEVDCARARKLLGWKPKHSLRRTLPRMLKALVENPEAWCRTNKLNPATVADKSPLVLGEREPSEGSMDEGKCGEGKCGSHMKREKPGGSARGRRM